VGKKRGGKGLEAPVVRTGMSGFDQGGAQTPKKKEKRKIVHPHLLLYRKKSIEKKRKRKDGALGDRFLSSGPWSQGGWERRQKKDMPFSTTRQKKRNPKEGELKNALYRLSRSAPPRLPSWPEGGGDAEDKKRGPSFSGKRRSAGEEERRVSGRTPKARRRLSSSFCQQPLAGEKVYVLLGRRCHGPVVGMAKKKETGQEKNHLLLERVLMEGKRGEDQQDDARTDRLTRAGCRRHTISLSFFRSKSASTRAIRRSICGKTSFLTPKKADCESSGLNGGEKEGGLSARADMLPKI